MKHFAFTILVCSLLSSSKAWAYLSLEEVLEYESKAETKQLIQMYVGGIMEGLWIANAEATRVGGKPVVCFPRDQSLQTEELTLLGMLALRRVKNDNKLMALVKDRLPGTPKLPASMFIRAGLSELNPCN